MFVIQHRLTSGHVHIFHQEKQANVHSQKLEHQHVPKRDPSSFSLCTKSIINGFLSQGGPGRGAKHRPTLRKMKRTGRKEAVRRQIRLRRSRMAPPVTLACSSLLKMSHLIPANAKVSGIFIFSSSAGPAWICAFYERRFPCNARRHLAAWSGFETLLPASHRGVLSRRQS